MTQLNGKIKELTQIKKAAEFMLNGNASQCFSAAAALGVLVSLICIMLMSATFNKFAVSIGTGFAVFFIAYQYLPLPKSWASVLDDRITAYDPVNHDAYAKLHASTRQKGGFDVQEVLHWVQAEYQAIDDRLPRQKDGTAQQFMSKTVEDRTND